MIKVNTSYLKKLFENKKFCIVFSIIAAFIIWLVITVNQKPTIERTFSELTVNINLENTFAAENEMSIISDISEQKFTVVVRGPGGQVGTLTSSDINLYASAATVDAPGNYNLEVAASPLASGSECEILSVSPSTLNVDFDYITSEEFTIVASAVGATAEEGLIAENGVVSGTETDTVNIKGPRTIINSIDKVVATAEVNKTLKVSETFDANIVIYDIEGNVIQQNNLTLSTTKVKVTVPISKKKVVPVIAEFSNLPEGFDLSSLDWSVDHNNVTIIGTPEIVDKTSQVSLSAIDITTVNSTSFSFDVSAKLPEGVRLLDSIDHFTVSIKLSGYVEKTIDIVEKAKFTGLSSDLKVSSKGVNIKNVKIFGPKNMVNKINSSNITAIIDLSDKKSGEHTVNAYFSFGDYTKIWQVGVYTTSVTIK